MRIQNNKKVDKVFDNKKKSKSHSKDNKNKSKNKMNIFSDSKSRSDKNLKTSKRLKSIDRQKDKQDNYMVNFNQVQKRRHCVRGC